MNHSAAKIKKYLKIWLLSLYFSLMKRLAYRFNFVLMCLGVFTDMALTIFFVKIIFGFINNLSGWTFGQALVVVASYMIIEGVTWATCAYLSGVSHYIYTGNMDYALVKAIDPQFSASIWRADAEDWARVITAGLVFAYALNHLPVSFPGILWNFFLYLIFIFNAFIINYSFVLLIKTLSFWTIKDNGMSMIAHAITSNSKYPIDIFYHRAARIIFSTVIPLAFMATVPAKIFINGFNFYLFASSCALAAFFWLLSRKFWLFALKKYSSVSS